MVHNTNARIPILMYHSISREKENDVHPYFVTNTSPEVFDQQMAYLHSNNYLSIGIEEALKLLSSDGQKNRAKDLHTNYVVITFDDGFRDFYTEAFPTLQKYGFSATVFLATGFIEKRKRFKQKECLNWDAVRELDRHGIAFGSHTVNHPVLVELRKEEVEYELMQSKQHIEDKLGKPVRSFAYPYAFPEHRKTFVKNLKNVLTSCGYSNGVSTRLGTTYLEEDRYFLPRIPLNALDDDLFFKAKLTGDYDWISRVQFIYKALKAKVYR